MLSATQVMQGSEKAITLLMLSLCCANMRDVGWPWRVPLRHSILAFFHGHFTLAHSTHSQSAPQYMPLNTQHQRMTSNTSCTPCVLEHILHPLCLACNMPLHASSSSCPLSLLHTTQTHTSHHLTRPQFTHTHHLSCRTASVQATSSLVLLRRIRLLLRIHVWRIPYRCLQVCRD